MFGKVKCIFKVRRYIADYEYLVGLNEVRLSKYPREENFLEESDVLTLRLNYVPQIGDRIFLEDTNKRVKIIDSAISKSGTMYYWLDPEFDTECDIAKRNYAQKSKLVHHDG